MSYIIIAQYEGKSFISKLIKWRTWSSISHTAALSQDENFIYEAWHKGGVQKNKWEDQPHINGTVINLYKVECSPAQAEAFYAYLESKLGTKYDIKAIVGFIFRVPLEGITELFCSQYVFEAAEAAGITLLKRIKSYKVSPGHIEISPRLNTYKTLILEKTDVG